MAAAAGQQISQELPNHALYAVVCVVAFFAQFFAEQGWSMLVRHSWRQAAGTYGWVPQVAAGSEGKPPNQEVQFSVSVVFK